MELRAAGGVMSLSRSAGRSGRVLVFSELVRTVQTDPLFRSGEQDSGVVVRVEVFRDQLGYFPVVWFREYFRLLPLMPLLDEDASRPEPVFHDAELLYLEDSLGFEDCRAPSSDAVLDLVAQKLGRLGYREEERP